MDSRTTTQINRGNILRKATFVRGIIKKQINTMNKYIFIIVIGLFITTITNAQLKVTSDGKVGITLSSTAIPQAALDLGTAKYAGAGTPLFLMYNDNNTGPFAGTKMGFYADYFPGGNNLNLVFPESSAAMGLFTISAKNTAGTTLNKYFSIAGMTGNVSIGNQNPIAKLDVQGYNMVFRNSQYEYPLYFYLHTIDPRICSGQKIVFYNNTNTGYIDIECKTVIEHSDSTQKTNVLQIDGSLNKLRKINGYTYNWKYDTKNTQKQSGLIAQQVERVIPEVVVTNDSTGGKMLAYTHLIPYLIEAIKEQQTQIEGLNDKIITLENNIQICCKSSSKTKSYIETESNINTSSVSSVATKTIKLYQNAPNPFKLSTVINMDIPITVKSAMVCIYDLNGRQLKCLMVNGTGSVSVQIYANELNPGMYHYALIADGDLIDTKTMVLTE